jgi:3-dehydroquinate synthetase
MLHGEAIALGMRAALFLSEKLTGLNPAESGRLLELLTKFQLPLTLDHGVTDDSILTLMKRDKKFVRGQRRFVLLERNGNAVLTEEVTDVLLTDALAHLRSEA